MKDMKHIFILGLIVGMILGGIIIVFSFFLGNSHRFLDQFYTPRNLAPYFQRKNKTPFSTDVSKPPFRMKRIERDGKEYVYILEGGEKQYLNKDKRHPIRKPATLAPVDVK